MDQETLRLKGLQSGALRPGALRLVVLGGGGAITHALPASGQVVLGRGEGSDLRIDEASISRRHAILHLGPPLRLEDLGSANGTRLRERALTSGEQAELAPGDAIELGGVLLVVQSETARPKAPQLLTHDYFGARVEDEVGRAGRSAATFAVARLRAAAAPEQVLAAIGAVYRPGDVVAAYGPGEYELLWVDTNPTEALALAQALSARLAALGPGGAVGLALFPAEAQGAAGLLACANDALAKAALPAAPLQRAPEQQPAAAAGDSGGMGRLRKLLERVAQSDISVVLLGETGAGKSALAAELHQRSPRAKGPFVAVNCAAVSEALLEAELFGHERGAFTGAVATRAGLFEAASGGTLFLDEIGELPLSMQAKLLEVLEERAVRRVGGTKKLPVDVRIVSATNRDLETAVAQGRFRADLWFRLDGIAVVVPPLRERIDEIAGLARLFVERAAKAGGRPAPPLTPQALAALERHPWPGNIRELRNGLERALLLCGDGPITPEHLPAVRGAVYAVPYAPPAPLAFAKPPPAQPPLERAPANEPLAAASTAPAAPVDPRTVERQRIAAALEQCGGNQGRAAKLLGISRRTLVTRLTQLDLPRPRKQ